MPSPVLGASPHGVNIPVEISNYTDAASCLQIMPPQVNCTRKKLIGCSYFLNTSSFF